MRPGKKFGVLVALIITLTCAIAATTVQQGPPPQQGQMPGPKNLKVLPKNISHEQLDHIMSEFKNALGVKCSYCHAQSKEDPKHLDFASDEKPEKGTARYMMKMTMRINKKFFEVKKPAIGDSSLVISCITCHHGEAHPELVKNNQEATTVSFSERRLLKASQLLSNINALPA